MGSRHLHCVDQLNLDRDHMRPRVVATRRPAVRGVGRSLTVMLVMVATSAAQSSETNWSNVKTLSSGTEVRITTAKSNSVTGKLESVNDTSLTINPGRGPQSIDRQQVTRVAVRTKARRKRAMLIGLAVGAAGGAAFGGAAASSCSHNICGGYGAALIAGAAAGGAILGAVIGAAVSHGAWREVYRQ